MLSLDFSKEHAYNRLVLPVKRGKKDEVFETIQCYFAASPFQETFAQADSPADTRQRIRTCAYADSLGTGILKIHQVKEAAGFLIEIMPVMFIPAGVGLLEAQDALLPVWIPVVVITVVTTVFVMAVTGQVTQVMIRKGKK